MPALKLLMDLKLLADRMPSHLLAMHGQNPVCGPPFVRNPGEVECDFADLQPASELQMAKLAPEPALAATR